MIHDYKMQKGEETSNMFGNTFYNKQIMSLMWKTKKLELVAFIFDVKNHVPDPSPNMQ